MVLADYDRRMRSPAPLAALLLCTAVLGSCGLPYGVEDSCGHASSAIEALGEGDETAAQDEVRSAMSWIDAAYEDAEGDDLAPLDKYSERLGVADASFGSEEGERALDEAVEICG